MKTILKAYALTILSVIAIIALVFPICTITVGAFGYEESESMTGFAAIGESALGMVLVIGPVLLAAMDYIKAIKPYKGKIAIAMPIVCIVCLVLVYIAAKKGIMVANGVFSGYGGVNIKDSIGFGFILALLSYLGMIVAGAVQYHGYTLDKAGLDRLKNEGTKLAEMAKEKAMEKVNEVSRNARSEDKTNSEK